MVECIGLFDGLVKKFCEVIFNCIRINSVVEEANITVNHVDVSSCGISL